MKNTLQGIQTFSKIAKLIAVIAFAFCVVGFVGCVIGVVMLAVGDLSSLVIDGVTLKNIMADTADLTVSALYATMISGMVFTAGGAVIAKFTERYFKNELDAGTPFTFDGAKELFKLSFIYLGVSLGCSIVSGITVAIIEAVSAEKIALSVGGDFGVGLFLAFLLCSFLCRYGAEISAEKNGVPTDKTEE